MVGKSVLTKESYKLKQVISETKSGLNENKLIFLEMFLNVS